MKGAAEATVEVLRLHPLVEQARCWIKDISWKAQNRLNARYKTLQKRLMYYNKIKVSIARELTAVVWEIGFKMKGTPAQPA